MMMIVDMAYCRDADAAAPETVAASGIVGGRRSRTLLIVQSNRAIVYQSARASATAFSVGGNAIALAGAANNSWIIQGNSLG
jgi:hypothetical protein